MSNDKLSPNVSSPPDCRGDIREWIHEIRIYLEKVLQEHDTDIQNLYETKADKV